MENWKSVRNVIITLAVLFTVDFVILILMLPKIDVYIIGILAILAITAIYFTAISLMLLDKLKTESRKNGKSVK